MSLKRKLKIVFEETGADPGWKSREHPGDGRRYVAKALDDGPGWMVWDRKREVFLKNREVRALSEQELREPWTQ